MCVCKSGLGNQDRGKQKAFFFPFLIPVNRTEEIKLISQTWGRSLHQAQESQSHLFWGREDVLKSAGKELFDQRKCFHGSICINTVIFIPTLREKIVHAFQERKGPVKISRSAPGHHLRAPTSLGGGGLGCPEQVVLPGSAFVICMECVSPPVSTWAHAQPGRLGDAMIPLWAP